MRDGGGRGERLGEEGVFSGGFGDAGWGGEWVVEGRGE